MIDIVGKRLWAFIFVAILVVVSIVSLVTFGLRTGLDFSSGSELILKFEQTVKAADIDAEVNNLGYSGTVEVDAHGNMVVRTVQLTPEDKIKLEADLTAKFGTMTELGLKAATLSSVNRPLKQPSGL